MVGDSADWLRGRLPRRMTGFKVLSTAVLSNCRPGPYDQMMVQLPKYYPVDMPVILMGRSGDRIQSLLRNGRPGSDNQL